MEDYLDTQTPDINDESSVETNSSPSPDQRTNTASAVWSCNEWDPLEEVIVGNPLNARFPTADRSTQVAEYPDRSVDDIPRGTFPQWVIDETEEDLNEFAKTLESYGVKVRRPDTWPHEKTFSTINWESQGY